MIYSIYSISKQEETAPPGSRKDGPRLAEASLRPVALRGAGALLWSFGAIPGPLARQTAFLSVNFLTDLLAGPYLILSLNEMAVFLHTPDPEKQNNAVPETAADIADRLYKRMQRINGAELELSDDDIDKSTADAGEEQ